MALRFFLWGKKTPKQTTRLIRLFSFNVQIISGPIYNHIIHDMTSKKQNKLLFFLHTTFSCGSMTRIILILSCVKLFGVARCSLGFIQRAPVFFFLGFPFPAVVDSTWANTKWCGENSADHWLAGENHHLCDTNILHTDRKLGQRFFFLFTRPRCLKKRPSWKPQSVDVPPFGCRWKTL